MLVDTNHTMGIKMGFAPLEILARLSNLDIPFTSHLGYAIGDPSWVTQPTYLPVHTIGHPRGMSPRFYTRLHPK